MTFVQQLTAWVSSTGIAALNRILPFLLILVAGSIIIKIVLTIVGKTLKKSKLEKAAHSLIKSVVRILLYGLLALICASSLGIDVTGVVALASVVTLALSLALQNSLTNIIGGFTLLYTHPFHSGDYVEIAAQSGTVQEIGMAYTKLLTPDNKLISIPNSAVVSAEIVNYTVTGKRRVDVNITAPYVTDQQAVLAALREAGQVENILEAEGITAVVTGYTDGGVQYSMRVWCKTDDYWPIYFQINERVREIFQREGLKMAYPMINVAMEK